MPRGALTEEVKVLMTEEGFEGTVRELRLLPYVMSTLLNNTSIERNVINPEELGIIKTWFTKGWVTQPNGMLKVSEEFLQKMQKVLRVGYLSEVVE